MARHCRTAFEPAVYGAAFVGAGHRWPVRRRRPLFAAVCGSARDGRGENRYVPVMVGAALRGLDDDAAFVEAAKSLRRVVDPVAERRVNDPRE